ncbi:hypothetical protein OJAV_G00183640 [Oryzias javanicus]|uniref:Uncharacterized protein n=1 Tax=Oryzias javanicus TaxID=123683 RepID=A0A437CD06_ORYJA|nr:hypothetical protein OJAV_G00183640 [Oryzias javanicus]
MASIMTATVLLLVLMQCCCCSARRNNRFLRDEFTKEEIEKCKCKRVTNATFKCPLKDMPVIRLKDRHKAMKKCLCDAAKTGGRPVTKKFCRSKPVPGPIPIPVLAEEQFETSLAIMYGITAGIVVFILLTNCVCSNTVEKLVDTGFTKQEIQRCACKRMKGKWKCPSGLVPKNDDARQDLMKCLCNHFYKTDHPKMQVFCPPRISRIQTPL